MIPKYVGWILLCLGGAVGSLITVFFACLKTKGHRDSLDLKDSRIHILQGQIEEKDAIIKGFIEKEKEKGGES